MLQIVPLKINWHGLDNKKNNVILLLQSNRELNKKNKEKSTDKYSLVSDHDYIQ